MAKVYASDLSSANSSNMISVLEAAKADISHLIGNLNDFSTGSVTELVGDGYDAVRAKMQLYIDCFNKLLAICSNLIPCIQAANNTMINFMEGYGELDDSKIPEVEAAITEAEAYLAWLQETYEVPGPDDNGDGMPDYYETHRNGTDAEIAACEATIRELKHYLEKLKQLAPTDKSAFASIEAVMADIANFATAVSELKIPNYNGVFPEDENEFAKELGFTNNSGERDYYAFSQYDKEWQGSGWHSKNNKDIAGGGCSVCALAALLATIYQNPEITPYTVGAAWAKHEAETGIRWENSAMGWAKAFCNELCGLDADPSFGHSVMESKDAIKNVIQNGGAVIASPVNGGHYIAIVGYDPETDTYIVADSDPRMMGYSQDANLRSVPYSEIVNQSVTMYCAVAPQGMTVEEAKRAKTANT